MQRPHHLLLTPIAPRLPTWLSAPLALRLDTALQHSIPELLDEERRTVAHVADLLAAVATQPDPLDLALLDQLVRRLQARLRALACQAHPELRAVERLDRLLKSERAEIMDAPWAPRWLHAAEMRWLEKLNLDLDNYARWRQLMLDAVQDVPDARIEDVAAGAAGFFIWLAQHAGRQDLQLTASDYSADYVAQGQRAVAQLSRDALPLAVVQRDATQLADLAGQVDLVVCTQATHHMSHALVARLLHQSLLAASRGVLVIDLLRSGGSLLAAALASNLSTPAPPLMLDAMQSVRRGFLPAELALLAHLAGAQFVRAEAFDPAYVVLRAWR